MRPGDIKSNNESPKWEIRYWIIPTYQDLYKVNRSPH